MLLEVIRARFGENSARKNDIHCHSVRKVGSRSPSREKTQPHAPNKKSTAYFKKVSKRGVCQSVPDIGIFSSYYGLAAQKPNKTVRSCRKGKWSKIKIVLPPSHFVVPREVPRFPQRGALEPLERCPGATGEVPWSLWGA